VGESEPIRLFDNRETVREITRRILIARADSREELDTELHGFSVSDAGCGEYSPYRDYSVNV
jgi:hypothetical protein